MALCSDMKGSKGRKNRLIVVVIVFTSVVVSSVCVAVAALHNYISSLNILDYHTGDIVNVKHDVNDFNTVLCQGYKVQRLMSSADVYFLPSEAKVDITKTKRSNYTYEDLDLYTDYNHGAFYLLYGSILIARSCWTQGPTIKVLLIKGDDSFSEWKSNSACASCIWRNITLDYSTNCSTGRTENLVGAALYSDNYYIVIVRAQASQKPYPWAYFTVNLEVKRAVYDVSGFTEICLADQKECVFNLTYNTNPDIIVDFHDQSLITSTVTIMTSCEKRVLFWLGLMFILPVGLILVCISTMCCVHHMGRLKDPLRAPLI